jgi:hypothetical protein
MFTPNASHQRPAAPSPSGPHRGFQRGQPFVAWTAAAVNSANTAATASRSSRVKGAASDVGPRRRRIGPGPSGSGS